MAYSRNSLILHVQLGREAVFYLKEMKEIEHNH